jgi:chaperonin GroES
LFEAHHFRWRDSGGVLLRGNPPTARGLRARAAMKPQEHTAMKIRPLQDRVIVKRVKEEEKTKGGIIIPDTAKEKPIEGEVIAVGNGKVQEDGKIRPLDIKAGDRVLFGKYAGTEVKIEGEEHLILREDDILGVIEK